MKEDKLIQVQTTTSYLEEAEKIAQEIIGMKTAACVKILPYVKSLYSWEGKTEYSEEVLLTITTTSEKYSEIEATIKKLNTYEVPEIVALKVKYGSQEYLRWAAQAVQTDSSSFPKKGI